MRGFYILVSVVLPMLVCACGGGTVEIDPASGKPVFSSLGESVKKPLDASNAAIERAKLALSTAPKAANPELLAKLEDAQAAIREVVRQQESVGQQLNFLLQATAEIQREKAALERDKADLEKRERLFSTGFYAALITALVALASVIGKFPMMRLDMQLKRLEIQEREQKLAQVKQESSET